MSAKPQPRCSKEQIREAAVWMTLLHGPDRTEKLERGFRRWRGANPAHAAAFETVSLGWESAAALPRGPFPRMNRWQRAGFRQGFLQAASAVAAAVALAVVGIFLHQRSAGVATDIGEQRMMTLEDGTRVFMNTDTRIVVHYDPRQRTVELKNGEALFEVAKQGAQRPFSVTAAGKRIAALGTAFVVRRDPDRLMVTLVEGKVAVRPIETDARPPIALTPGQRLIFVDRRSPQVDEPAIEKVTAWRSGYVDLVEMPLADAVEEMNRYSRVKVRVADPEAAAIPVSGIFRAGDIQNFVHAVADAYGLQVVQESGRTVLTGKPANKPN